MISRSNSYGRVVLWSLVTLLFISSSAIAQSGPFRRRASTGPSMRSGNSTVKGHVVYKDNKEGLKNAELRIFDSEGATLTVFSNARGEFQVPNLAAGQYYVSVQGPGIAMQSGFGMKLPIPISAIPRSEDFQQVIPKHDGMFTVNGTDDLEIEISVPRGGTISGKVVKGNGSALPFAQVNLMSREGGGPYTARFSTQTDKDGLYKITNIPVGDYIVAVSIESKSSSSDIRARLRGETQIVTFHPTAITAKDAASVHVDTGRETGGVNITFVDRQSFSVSGTVVQGRDGTPLIGATVLLRSKETELTGPLMPGMGQRTTRTDAEGRWSFNNVAQGEYVVTALAPTPRTDRLPGAEPSDPEQRFRESRQRYLVAQQEVVLGNISLEGVVLPINGPGAIVGNVETDDGSAVPANLVIFLEQVSKTGRQSRPMLIRLQPGGSFVVEGIPGGETYVSIALPAESSYFVKSLTVGGSDASRSPLRIIEGAEAGPLQVTISQSKAVVTGQVQRQSPTGPLQDVVVLFVPSDADKQRFRTSYLTARPDDDGKFVVTGPPGDYHAFARRRDDLPPIVTGDFVRSLGTNAQRINIKAGQANHIELPLP